MPSDEVVNAQDVLRAVMELRRRGNQPVIEELEKLEPDLTEFLLEELGLIHQQLLDLGAKPRQVRRLARSIEAMAVVLVTALRRAHLRLWQQDAAEGPLAEFDPFLAADGEAPRDEPGQRSSAPDEEGFPDPKEPQQPG